MTMRTFALAAALALTACSHRTIPGTNIDDTREVREVLDVFGQYKNAMEARDGNALLQLTAPNYFDGADPQHPVDAAALQRTLPHQFDNVTGLKLEVKVKDVDVKGDAARVDYYAVLRYSVKTPNEEKWKPTSDDARMRFARINGEWKITSGL